MNKRHDLPAARERAEKMRLAEAVITVAICGDEKTAKCASKADLRDAWKHLKRRAKQIRKQGGSRIVVMRTECLGVCRFGPVAAVFPSGDWYGGCAPAILDRILAAHLDGGEAPLENRITSVVTAVESPANESSSDSRAAGPPIA